MRNRPALAEGAGVDVAHRAFVVVVTVALSAVEPAWTQEPKSVRAASIVDPYTEGAPAALSRAGYVSFGPFPFGLRHGSTEVMALLGDEPLVWVETEHFRIGCALSPIPLRGDSDWVSRTKAELERLKTRLPKVKADTRRLDPWLRTHLIAQRCEDLYREIQGHLGVRDDSFPASPERDVRGDPRSFRGCGPYLGMPEKFAVLIVQRAASLARYTRAYQGQETQQPARHFDHEYGSMAFAVAEETSDGLLKDDFALHTHLVYNLTFNLYSAYRFFGHDLPPWLIGGLAHWHSRRICPRFPAYERRRDSTDREQRDFWQWDQRAPGLLRNGAFEPIETLTARTDLTAFGLEQHIQSWAFVDFLMSTRKPATMRFLHIMKDPFHRLERPPSKEQLRERANACWLEAFALDPAGLEAEWRRHVLGSAKK